LETINKLKKESKDKEQENEKISRLQNIILEKETDGNEQRRLIKELKNKIEMLEKSQISEGTTICTETEEDEDDEIYLIEEEIIETKKRKIDSMSEKSQEEEKSDSLIFDNFKVEKEKKERKNFKKTISFKVYKDNLNEIFSMISSNDKILSEEFHNILMNQVMTENKSPILLFPILIKFIDFSKKNENIKLLESTLNFLSSLFVESEEFRKLNLRESEGEEQEIKNERDAYVKNNYSHLDYYHF
jgi:hypothetical protein